MGSQSADLPFAWGSFRRVRLPRNSEVDLMPDYDTVLADASRLPVVDRIQLIEALWDTVPDEAAPPLSEEWLAEIQSRSAELDAGTAKTVPWEQVRADAIRRLRTEP